MPQYVRGNATSQAHVGLPPGTIEEEHGRRGFYGRATHLYRRRPPTGWVEIDGPLRPRALDLQALATAGEGDEGGREGAPGALPVDILVSRHLRLGVWRREKAMPFLFRDADGDLILFVHAGEGTLETDFGPLAYRRGDYLVLPRGTTFRLAPEADTWLFTIATAAEVEPPDRGLLGGHALWDPAAVRVPDVDPHDAEGRFEVVIRRGGALTSVIYPHHPLDVVGWKGDLAAFALNVDDLRPVSSYNYHLPPSAHTTFRCGDAVVCSFVPRPLETDPDALKVPFYHRNIDYDEVIFYHHGDFFSRAGISPGDLTWHPQGIHHGPHPQAVDRAGSASWTDEIAVMVDSPEPLALTEAGGGVERPDYWRSWME